MAFSYNYCYSKIKQHCYDDDTSSLWAWDSVAYNTGDTKAHSDTWMKSHRLAYNDQYALAYHAADYLCHDCANARHILKIVLQLVVLHSRHIIHPMVSLVNFFTPLPIWERSIVMTMSVSVCFTQSCLSESISPELQSDLHKFFRPCYLWLWMDPVACCDMLCTSGFYRAMLCIRSTSHWPVSVSVCLYLSVCVCHKSEFY